MSTTMVKISTLASAVDTPEKEALSPQPLSLRQFDPFPCFSSKSMSPQGAEAMAGGHFEDQVKNESEVFLDLPLFFFLPPTTTQKKNQK